jgi:hypothetical protein
MPTLSLLSLQAGPLGWVLDFPTFHRQEQMRNVSIVREPTNQYRHQSQRR